MDLGLTHKVFPPPNAVIVIDGHLKPDIAFSLEKRLDANGSVLVDGNGVDFLSIESAFDHLVGLKARSSYVYGSTTQHVATLGGKREF